MGGRDSFHNVYVYQSTTIYILNILQNYMSIYLNKAEKKKIKKKKNEGSSRSIVISSQLFYASFVSWAGITNQSSCSFLTGPDYSQNASSTALYNLAPQGVLRGPAASASPGSWTEIWNLKSHPRTTELKSAFKKIPRWTVYTVKFEKHESKQPELYWSWNPFA